MKNTGFLDSRTILAIVLVGVVWFGWQSYLTKKYPNMGKPVTTTTTTINGQGSSKPEGTVSNTPTTLPAVSDNGAAVIVEEKLLKLENQFYTAEVSNLGMALENVVVNGYKDRSGNEVRLGNASGIFGLFINGENRPAVFEFTEVSNIKIIGEAKINGAILRRTISLDEMTGALKNQIELVGNQDSQIKMISFQSEETKHPAPEASFFFPSFEHQDLVTVNAKGTERLNISASKEMVNSIVPGVLMTGIGSQYFAFALSDQSQLLPEVRVTENASRDTINHRVVYDLSASSGLSNLNFTSYVGAKSISRLSSIDSSLPEMINFGFFASIAKVLLKLLNIFHSFVINWGLAIILVTLLVRILVLPFNVASYKSMKKMQVIQPKIQAIREKYKDDSQKMNSEVMSLMRDQKVNPLGGCLPMLLQMPIFFALYQVLGQSIELYNAPFIFWVSDLSSKDPFYVLPVLMGLSMYIQMKITPSTMDPTQAKIMQFMPLIFTIPMLALPSGLTLYMLVSTLFGIVQQQIFMRDKSSQVTEK